MINKIEFTTKNLTSYAGLLPILNYIHDEGIFQWIDENLQFDKASTNEIKMNHIKSLLSLNIINPDKLSRIELLRGEPLLFTGFGITVRKAENVSRFLKNFDFRTTQAMRDINFKVFKKLLRKSKLREITVDIDSTVINVEGNQEGAKKGYNPGHKGNKCYNDIVATCWELKAFITGYQRPGNTYTANGAEELIREIVAQIKPEVDQIIFRMDSGYFSEDIIKVIEELGCQYVIKAKNYSGMTEKLYNRPAAIWEKFRDKEITAGCIKPDKWDNCRKFVVVRELKSFEERSQLSLLESDSYTNVIYATNICWEPQETVWFYEKRGNCENYIKEMKNDMGLGNQLVNSFWANEAILQFQILAFNLILLFKIDRLQNEYFEQVKTFRFKYVFVAAKIVRSSRQQIMKMPENYPYKEVYLIKRGA